MARGAPRKGAWKKPREVYYKKQIDKKQAKALSRGIIQYEEHKERVRADRPGYQATKPRITTREGVGFTTASPLIPMKVAKKYGKGLSRKRTPKGKRTPKPPKDFVNWMAETSPRVIVTSEIWDVELEKQKRSPKCPPYCTPYEFYLINKINPGYTRR